MVELQKHYAKSEKAAGGLHIIRLCLDEHLNTKLWREDTARVAQGRDCGRKAGNAPRLDYRDGSVAAHLSKVLRRLASVTRYCL